MGITREMVDELNRELGNMGCAFRYEFFNDVHNPTIKITLLNTKHIDSFIVNITDEFYEWLSFWFGAKGIQLSCNNTRDIMWSKTGWQKLYAQCERYVEENGDFADFCEITTLKERDEE